MHVSRAFKFEILGSSDPFGARLNHFPKAEWGKPLSLLPSVLRLRASGSYASRCVINGKLGSRDSSVGIVTGDYRGSIHGRVRSVLDSIEACCGPSSHMGMRDPFLGAC
jgi:hypothetical protein